MDWTSQMLADGELPMSSRYQTRAMFDIDANIAGRHCEAL
jgi:hypothetical protein